MTSLRFFLGLFLAKLLITLNFWCLLGQALSSVISRWTIHFSLLFCKHYPMLFICILFLCSTTSILSSELTLHNHLTILASFISRLINISLSANPTKWSNTQTGLCLPYLAKSHFHRAWHYAHKRDINLPFTPKSKPLLVNKGNKIINA